jgi:mycoredoxin-dependent peroxiredoxin
MSARRLLGAFVDAGGIGYYGWRAASRSQYSIRSLSEQGGSGMAISVGAAAPDFVLKDQSQKEVKLSDFQGKKNVVIVFYPLDWSPVCTNEHACFVNDMKRFEQLDAQVLGISVDSAWSHKAFAEKMGIHYPLLADFQPRGAVGEKFGVYLAEKGITGRAIAIVDRSGKIAWFKNYDIPTVPDLKEVADALGTVK